jgi:hypothetical protein
VEKRNAAVAARREAEEGRRKSEERSLHFAGRLLRRSEAEKQKRRPASVGMTGLGGGANDDSFCFQRLNFVYGQ